MRASGSQNTPFYIEWNQALFINSKNLKKNLKSQKMKKKLEMGTRTGYFL